MQEVRCRRCNSAGVLVRCHVTAQLAYRSSVLVQKILIRDGINDDVRRDIDRLFVVAYSGIFFRGGSTKSVEDREQIKQGSGGGSPYSGVLLNLQIGETRILRGSSNHCITTFVKLLH
jgi:hypothetical protein